MARAATAQRCARERRVSLCRGGNAIVRRRAFARAVSPGRANSRGSSRRWRDGRGDLARRLSPGAQAARLDRSDGARMELGVANEPDDRLGERVDVVRIAVEPESAPDLRHGGGVRRDAGLAEPQALTDRQPPALGEARKDCESGPAVEPDQLLVPSAPRSRDRELRGRRA